MLWRMVRASNAAAVLDADMAQARRASILPRPTHVGKAATQGTDGESLSC